MAYKAKITQLTNLKPHPNADRVQLAICHGNQVVVSIHHKEGDIGIYFDSDGQLSEEFCKMNNLFRDTKLNSDTQNKGGFFDVNRRVRTQKFRGEISDGLWLPLQSLNYIPGFDPKKIENEFDNIDGHTICNKYVNKQTIEFAAKNRTVRAAKKSVMFKEHFDTEHFGKNMDKFNKGDFIIITEKLHGTSGRVGYVKVERNLKWYEYLLKKIGVKIESTNWEYLNGTRRVVLQESNGKQFHDPTIREKSFELFNGKLKKGETVYFEIVGFESNGNPIMPSVSTKLINDKNFTKKYGDTITYTYGCKPNDCDVYVYRITSTNEDGDTIDYSWSDVVKRCGELGVKTVPEIKKFIYGDSIETSEDWFYLVSYFANGESRIDNTHISEGVCVRIEGGLENKTFKYKSFEFKVLEGIIKDLGQIDQEEAQSL